MQKYLKITWRLWLLLKPFHKYLYIQLFLIFILQAISISMTIFLSKLLDGLVSKNLELLTLTAFYFVCVGLIEIVITFVLDQNEIKHQYKIQQYLEEFSFKKIFSLTISQHVEDHSSIKLQVVNRGEAAVESIVSTLFLSLIPSFFNFILSLGTLFYYSTSVGLVIFFVFLVLLFVSYKWSNFHSPLIKKNIENWDIQRKVRTESFTHLSLVKILAVAPKFLSKYLEERVAVTAYSEYIWILNVKYVSLRNLFIFITQVLVLFLTARLYLAGQLSVGVIYIFFALTSRIFGLIASITRILRQIPIRFVELEKYLEIIDKTPEFKEGGEDSFSEGDVIFSDVSFRYPKGDEDVLKNISISIPKGKKVAFVGHSGSGKTTLTKLLLRSYNYTSGSILLGGKELKDIDADSLRENIGYVEQHVDLFDDTVKNNILLSVKAETLLEWEEKVLTEGKLEDVAKLARIDEFYHRLGEKKFDTEIGERGIKLSGGERQRIGIARAIIKEPAILIFDEATSALDAVNERYIKEAIDNVSEGRTTLIIAHRLSTVVGCDCIYVLDRGRVVASGTHTELLKKSPEYQDLIKNQNLLA